MARTFTIPNVTNGHHFVWAVLGFSDHLPYEVVAVRLIVGVEF